MQQGSIWYYIIWYDIVCILLCAWGDIPGGDIHALPPRPLPSDWLSHRYITSVGKLERVVVMMVWVD